MIVLPTVLMVRNGSGTPARHASFVKMNCSSSPRAWPPYSFGQPMPSQPSRPIFRTASRQAGPAGVAARHLGLHLRRHQLGEVLAHLPAQCLLLRCVGDSQAQAPLGGPAPPAD